MHILEITTITLEGGGGVELDVYQRCKTLATFNADIDRNVEVR